MEIGVPREIKPQENRLGLTPAAVAELTRRGHRVLVQSRAGSAIGFRDADYQAAGALLVADADTLYGACELIVKVKEPLAQERAWLTPDHCLFTYLHLAADRQQTEDLLNSGALCIAYETVSDAQGGLPLLAPMSEVAGRMAIQAGAHCLETPQGGRGVLPGSVLVDVAIDQGGCAETSRPTTHDAPTYMVDEVVHYCVSNMPGAVARTATLALNNATLPFVIALAEHGCRQALRADAHLRAGLNIAGGQLTHPGVARAHGLPWRPAEEVLGLS